MPEPTIQDICAAACWSGRVFKSVTHTDLLRSLKLDRSRPWQLLSCTLVLALRMRDIGALVAATAIRLQARLTALTSPHPNHLGCHQLTHPSCPCLTCERAPSLHSLPRHMRQATCWGSCLWVEPMT